MTVGGALTLHGLSHTRARSVHLTISLALLAVLAMRCMTSMICYVLVLRLWMLAAVFL